MSKSKVNVAPDVVTAKRDLQAALGEAITVVRGLEKLFTEVGLSFTLAEPYQVDDYDGPPTFDESGRSVEDWKRCWTLVVRPYADGFRLDIRCSLRDSAGEEQGRETRHWSDCPPDEQLQAYSVLPRLLEELRVEIYQLRGCTADVTAKLKDLVRAAE
jgi:hypothetical protein